MYGFTSRKSHSRKTRKSGRTNIRQHPMKVKNNPRSNKYDSESKTELDVQRHKKIAELEVKKDEKHFQDKAKKRAEKLEKKARLDTYYNEQMYNKASTISQANVEAKKEAENNPDPRKSITITGIEEANKFGSPVPNTGREQHSENTKFNPEDQPYRELQKNMEKIINDE